jgi:hypothetical protein
MVGADEWRGEFGESLLCKGRDNDEYEIGIAQGIRWIGADVVQLRKARMQRGNAGAEPDVDTTG